jgi:ABC-type dipeptide/oligopeptide/nickel transport system ATPase component
MNSFSILIKDIQHIKELAFSLDLSQSGLHVIIGKNGVGKTMLFKGIQNLITSNTFKTTSNRYIYKESSSIVYQIEDKSYNFTYSNRVETLDFKGEVPDNILKNIYVELPIPFGERFKQFQKIGQADREIRLNIIAKNYKSPTSLIEMLNYIYDTNRFDDLKEIRIRKEKYYVIVLEDDYYIREDYLSSGEYFILNIYKLIQKRCKLIAIDEIDISLDAMAQVRFVEKLRELSHKYGIKLLFSTHSLALIKTLREEELYYMELTDGICSFENKSYNYIKSLLYGFQDYDKYILTEDEMLQAYMEFVLKDMDIFAKYIILPIGGASNTVELMKINRYKKVFEEQENVCTILDRDMKEKKAYKNRDDILFSPFQDIEDECLNFFKSGKFGTFTKQDLKEKYNVQREPTHKDYSKSIWKMLLKHKIRTKHELFELISNQKAEEVEVFRNQLRGFLNNSSK